MAENKWVTKVISLFYKGVEGPLLTMGDVITKPQLSSGNVRPTNDMNHESSRWVKNVPGFKGQFGVPLAVYPWYLLCSLGILVDYHPLNPTIPRGDPNFIADEITPLWE